MRTMNTDAHNTNSTPDGWFGVMATGFLYQTGIAGDTVHMQVMPRVGEVEDLTINVASLKATFVLPGVDPAEYDAAAVPVTLTVLSPEHPMTIVNGSRGVYAYNVYDHRDYILAGSTLGGPLDDPAFDNPMWSVEVFIYPETVHTWGVDTSRAAVDCRSVTGSGLFNSASTYRGIELTMWHFGTTVVADIISSPRNLVALTEALTGETPVARLVCSTPPRTDNAHTRGAWRPRTLVVGISDERTVQPLLLLSPMRYAMVITREEATRWLLTLTRRHANEKHPVVLNARGCEDGSVTGRLVGGFVADKQVGAEFIIPVESMDTLAAAVDEDAACVEVLVRTEDAVLEAEWFAETGDMGYGSNAFTARVWLMGGPDAGEIVVGDREGTDGVEFVLPVATVRRWVREVEGAKGPF